MKRGIVNRFDQITGKETAKLIKNWNKNQPCERGRSIKQIRIKYTYILQTWYYEEKTYTQKFICPPGMVKYMKKVLKDQKLFPHFSFFPNTVKEAFSVTISADYDHGKLKIQCKDEGDKGYDNFYILLCSTGAKDKYPDFIKKFKGHLPENPKIEGIQEHWDAPIFLDSTVAQDHDFCGCIIPNDPSIIAGPNNRQFILRLVEHADKYHKLKKTELSQKRPAVTENKNPPPAEVVVKKKCTSTLVGNVGQLATYKNCSQIGSKGGEKVRITVKGGNIKFSQKNMALMLDPKISIFESPKNSTEQWSQDYALSTVLSGANKNFLQAAMVHLYETAMGGVRGYHKTVLGDLELNGKKIPPPPKVALNEHNISQFQNGLLLAYKQLNRSDSHYNSLRGSVAKYYSVSNDGIEKFSMELNGIDRN